MNPEHPDISIRETSPIEKLITSLINVAVAFVLLLPFLFLNLSAFHLKLILVGLFFFENLYCLFFHRYRLPGMILQKTYWKEKYPKHCQIAHAILYTVSFSTLLFWLWFPADLLLLNLLVLQLPCILLTGITLHGFISGGMVDVKDKASTGNPSS